MVDYIETTESTVRLAWGDNDTVNVTGLKAATVAYLLQYGVNQTLQDACANACTEARKAHKAANAGEDTKATDKAMAKAAKAIGRTIGSCVNMDEDTFVQEVADVAMSARWEKVISGEMDIPIPGSKVTGMAKMMRDVAIGIVKAKADALKLKLTEANLKANVDSMLASESGSAMVKAECDRQIAARQALANAAEVQIGTIVDLNNLFANAA